MSLEARLQEISSRLLQGRFPNEQAISQGVVLPVLQELGWDVWDPTVVWPEYQTGQGRADFALCHPALKPAVFIEVKQPGKAEDSVRQALEYSFHTGVPFAVLTDGKTWSFYLPAEQGSYEDRRVYKLDLYEQAPDKAAEALQHYLAPGRVASGEALEDARKEYRSRNRRSQARSTIPGAWQDLVEKGDELLVELVANAVESKVGIRPEDDDVAQFLSGLGKYGSGEVRSGAEGNAQPAYRPPTPDNSIGASRRAILIMFGRARACSNAKEAMVTVLRELANRDATLLERCHTHPDMQGRKRRYIARTTEELYPGRTDLHDMHEQLPGGWLVATNLNNVLKKSIIRVATELAGFTFGSEIVVDF